MVLDLVFGKTYQLVEEQDARCGWTSFVEDISDVGLALTKPHGQQLWTFDWDEIGLALVGDGFGQQSFTYRRKNPKWITSLKP